MIVCDFCNRPAEAVIEIDKKEFLICSSEECRVESQALIVDSDAFPT